MNPDTPQAAPDVVAPAATAVVPGQTDPKCDEIKALLVRLKDAVADKNLESCQQLERKIVNALNQTRSLTSQQRQAIIQGLEAFQPGIRALATRQYQGSDGARHQLIAKIRSIHDAESDLEKVARHIKQAREEWKQWDSSGKGGDHELYKEFDTVCNAAYAPCQKWFDEQQKQREAASKHRKAVCEALETYYQKTDWSEPDWKAVQQTVREQSARWRKLGGAEYQDRKPLQKRYEEITNRFSGPLDRERKRNLAQRQELVAEVEKLAALEDSRRAIAELQKLKKQWQVSVSSKRKQEQQVWKQFTAACDAIYERGRESRKAHDAEQKAQLAQKQLICEEIEAACKTSVTTDDDANGDADSLQNQIRSWRQRWKESGRIPGAGAKKIEKRYRDGIKAVEKRHKQQQSAQQTNREKQLLEGAALCAEAEAAILGSGSGPDAATMDQYAGRWAALQETDPSTRALLEPLGARFKLAMAAATDDSARQQLDAGLDENFHRVNELLLQLEIKTGVDSPEAYAKQRMALQINRLSAAMGKGNEADLSAADLVQQIHTTGAVSVAQQAQINQRFTNCYQVLQNDRN